MVIQFPERKFPGKGSMSSQAFSAKGAPPVVIPLSRRLGPWSLASSCLSLLSRPFAPNTSRRTTSTWAATSTAPMTTLLNPRTVHESEVYLLLVRSEGKAG